MQSRRSSRRGLNTARRALRVVWLLAARPEGVRSVVRGSELRVVLEQGHQGMPKLPGLTARIGDKTHALALALGKVALALAPPEVVTAYLRRSGLRPFTTHTITRPDVLRAELAAIRSRGFAVGYEEFGEHFCCIAARGGLVEAALPHAVGALARSRFQPSAETDPVLDSPAEAGVTCSNGSTVPVSVARARPTRTPARPRVAERRCRP